MPTHQEQIAGGLIGLLVGDALGVPYEFTPPEEIPPLAEIEFNPPSNFEPNCASVPSGTWSDDGAQALCLLASLLECGRVDPEDLGQRFLNWYTTGYMAVDNRVFDIGIHTSRVLKAIQGGMPALAAGMLDEQAKGNGSLMRVLPLALWHRGSHRELIEQAHLQSQVTHGAITCQVCCALYCLWARHILDEAEDPWQSAVAALRQLYPKNSLYYAELEYAIRPNEAFKCEGTGYVVDCLHSARLAMASESYEQVVKTAIAFGNDTDTTACVAGGLAGLRDGIESIPQRWRDRLRGKEWYQPLLERLLINI